jgi:hypothetical protein
MNFRRPFRAELIGEENIWILDADGVFVTRFPRTSEDIAVDLARAQAVARSDTGEDWGEDLLD